MGKGYEGGFLGTKYYYDHPRDSAIIDSSGNITFYKEQEVFEIFGYGDGKFLVAEFVSDFDTNEWRVGAIDKDGNIVVPPKAYEITGDEFSECSYLGSNIFSIGNVLLNIETQSIIDLQTIPSQYAPDFYTDFEEGYAIISIGVPPNHDDLLGEEYPYLWGGKYKSGVYKLGTDGEIIEKIADCWEENTYGRFSEGLIFLEQDGDGVYYDEFGVGYQYAGGAYYDVYGEVVIDFPEYRGKKNYNCGAFDGGYAPMVIIGADGLSYFTLIDKNGKQMFEPRADVQNLDTSDGKYFIVEWSGDPEQSYESFSVFDITSGELLLSVVNTSNFNELISAEVSCGMLRVSTLYYGDIYVNIEDGSVIGLVPDELYVEMKN
jgi:hypothetical protein